MTNRALGLILAAVVIALGVVVFRPYVD